MGFKFSEDGECIVCGQHSNKFCDACKKYICDKHMIEVPIENSTESRILCPECYKKGEHPRNHQMPGLHPHYHF